MKLRGLPGKTWWVREGLSTARMRLATWPSAVRSSRALTIRAAASLLETSSVTCNHAHPQPSPTKFHDPL